MGNPFSSWGTRIRRAREARGLTQTGLADVIGVAQASVSRWERGEGRPGDREKVAIAAALGTTPAELFPWDEVAA